MKTTKAKTLLAMSGGVDSSVAAALLLEQGYDVVGCFMRLGASDAPGEGLIRDDDAQGDACCDSVKASASPNAVASHKQGCCSVGDAHDARLVAAALGIPLYICNFQRDFGRIMDYFVAEHQAGRTPNPCVRCNDWLKFGKLHDYARQIGASYVASGHHARIVRVDGRAELWRGVDDAKDQSYVLFGASRQRLSEMLLPVGEMTKADVRSLAQSLDLPVFDKPDSQEICFVPDQNHAAFVEKRAPELRRTGAIVDTQGQIVGEHHGHHAFTIGQRRGVGLALGRPIYVVDKDPVSNIVTVGDKKDLAIRSLIAQQTNWTAHEGLETELEHGLRALIQYRAHGARTPGMIQFDADSDTLRVRFDAPVIGVAPGQAVVCYDLDTPDRVLGGGWISETTRA